MGLIFCDIDLVQWRAEQAFGSRKAILQTADSACSEASETQMELGRTKKVHLTAAASSDIRVRSLTSRRSR